MYQTTCIPVSNARLNFTSGASTTEVLWRLKETVDEDEVDREALWEEIDRLREEGPTIRLDPMELKRIMREELA